MGSHARGFTVIETILFLAISGLLLVGALTGVTANINNSRFNDGLRSTVSYLQREYNEVASGLSSRSPLLACDSFGAVSTGGPGNLAKYPGMTDCIILGRFIKLEGSSLTSRYIIGHRASLVGLSSDDTDAILGMSPKVAGTLVYGGMYDIPSTINIIRTRLAVTNSPASGLAIIKSPVSGNVLYYTWGDVVSPEPVLNSSNINDANLKNNAVICMSDGARTGRINILSEGRGQEVIQADLTTTGACP